MAHWYEVLATGEIILHDTKDTWAKAKKQPYMPGVTTILKEQSQFGLELWKQREAIKIAAAIGAEVGKAMLEVDVEEVTKTVTERMAAELEAKAEIGSAIHYGVEELVKVANGEKQEADLSWAERLGHGDAPNTVFDDALIMAMSMINEARRERGEGPIQAPDVEIISEQRYCIPDMVFCGTGDLLFCHEGIGFTAEIKTRHGNTKRMHRKEACQLTAHAHAVGANPGFVTQYIVETGEIIHDTCDPAKTSANFDMLFGCALLFYGTKSIDIHERRRYVFERLEGKLGVNIVVDGLEGTA